MNGESTAEPLAAAQSEMRRCRAVIECYRVFLACAGGAPPKTWDPAITGRMEGCLERLGEPVMRTRGEQLRDSFRRYGLVGILSGPTRRELEEAERGRA